MIAAAHSRGTLSSRNNPVQQYDTIYTYRKAGDVCHELSREIEDEGYRGVAVPVYMPMDMRIYLPFPAQAILGNNKKSQCPLNYGDYLWSFM